MEPAAYAEYLERLVVTLAADERVLGALALGDTARGGAGEWSDHEVWVVAVPDADRALRSDPSWLPRSGHLVLWVRESPLGMRAVYDDGHAAALWVSGPDGMTEVADPGAGVLLDKGGVAERLRDAHGWAAGEAEGPGSAHLAGRFVAALVAGLRRHGAGERLAARRLIGEEAVAHLLALAGRTGEGSGPVGRRDAERSVPDLAARIDAALGRPLPEAALELLAAAESVVRPRMEEWPDGAAVAVRRLASALLRRR